MITQEDVLNKLKKVIYPNFSKDIVSFGFVKSIALHEKKCAISIDIPASSEEIKSSLESSISKELSSLGLELLIDIKTPKPRQDEPSQDKQRQEAQVKNIAPNITHFVMVSSGKGGVGKSTTSVNLAISLAKSGKKVGLLDADIYGPNIPRMLGVQDIKPDLDESNTKLIPVMQYGIKIMSLGMLYEKDVSLIWRGPMIMRAITQMLSDVIWGDLDILVIDMPPGTGDAQLTLAQSVPVSAGINVSTPQKVALDDSYRALDMFLKLNIPIAGVIENMSGFLCPKSNEIYEIFGKGNIKELAEKFNTKILAKIPLQPDIANASDEGKPLSYFEVESLAAKKYMECASFLIDFLDEVQARKLASNSGIQPSS